jgi:hypothetical protein
VLGGRLCPLCTSAISLEYPTNELIALRNVIASQIDIIDDKTSGLELGRNVLLLLCHTYHIMQDLFLWRY